MVDDIADGDNKNKSSKLNNLQKKIIYEQFSEISKISEIETLIKNQIVDKMYLIYLIDGVKKDLKKVHIKSQRELINYAYLVAGTVGLMMSKVLGAQNTYAERFAIDLGIAMQITNIARDIIEDAKLKRVYIPKSWIKIDYKDILKKNDTKTKYNLKYATNKLYLLSEKYYKSALYGLAFLPFKERFAILLALVLYRNIGRKIIKNNYSNIYKREYLSIKEKFYSFVQSLYIFLFNRKLHKECFKHNKSLHVLLNKKHRV